MDHGENFSSQPFYQGRSVIIGIYGLPGSGKSFLLNKLKLELAEGDYLFIEGAEVIASIHPGGLKAFQKLDEKEKARWRELAINTIRADCINDGKTGLVTGHFMFWNFAEDQPTLAWTQHDLDTFTHIIYLNLAPEQIYDYQLKDQTRERPSTTIEHLRLWQLAEKTQLRSICYGRGIVFATLDIPSVDTSKTRAILKLIRQEQTGNTLNQAMEVLDGIVESHEYAPKSMLVLDADKTLSADDSGVLFWNKIRHLYDVQDNEDPLKALFGGRLGYSSTAFVQAILLYEEWADDETYERLCTEIASGISLYEDIEKLLQVAKSSKHTAAIVITCGLRRVWEIVLENAGLFNHVKVIGGGRVSDGIVIDSKVKADLVSHLRRYHGMHVTALGDGVLDMRMLAEADKAVVIVGDEASRSKRMEKELEHAIDTGRLAASQAVLVAGAPCRLNTNKLPLVHLNDPAFIASILRYYHHGIKLEVLHMTETPAAKVLGSSMRNAVNNGPQLREIHRQVGWYLAIHYLPDVLGIETYQIQHVQGHSTDGHRLARESQTLIVALMRGGEPMAFGVNDAFPLASFLHAKNPEDITKHHLTGTAAVILVDSVVNSGKSVNEFLRWIHTLDTTVRIVIVTGVLQVEAVSKIESVQVELQHKNVSLVTLRESDNKFTGHGGTDTGNRLFNTTRLD